MPVISRAGKSLLASLGSVAKSSLHARLPRPPVLNAVQHVKVLPRTTAPKAMQAAPATWREQLERARQTTQKPATSLPPAPKGSSLLARRAELASARHVERLAQLRQVPHAPGFPKPLADTDLGVRPKKS